ncbi:MAG: Uma2 family endonuclease [Thermoanaerobaculia bacterium]
MAAIPFRQDVFYPESDGKPMGETEVHIREIVYLFQALNEHLRETPDVYVGADMFLYYVQGQPKSVVAPDVFVVRGVRRGVRRTFKLWEEGAPPCLVVEVTSDGTRNEDVVKKKAIYQKLGVKEYVLRDPLGDYLKPSLQGFRLVNGRYRPIPLERDGGLVSQTTGVTFTVEDQRLRLIQTATGEPILSDEEVRVAKRAAEEQARAAQEENARLHAEIERLRGLS